MGAAAVRRPTTLGQAEQEWREGLSARPQEIREGILQLHSPSAATLGFHEQTEPRLSLPKASWLCPTGTLQFPDWAAASRVKPWGQEIIWFCSSLCREHL